MEHTVSRRAPRARTLVGVGLAAVVLATCGVGSQDEPTPIPPEDVPFDLTVPSTRPRSTTSTTTGIVVVPTSQG